MKKIFTIMLAAMFVAGTAYAVEIETSGKFEVRGSMISNPTGLSADNTPSYSYYDQELDMNVNLKITDYTKIKTNFEIRDQNWLNSNLDDSKVVADEDKDDTIEFKRVYSTHAFATGTIVDLGLMDGGAWGTEFADNVNGTWRVKALQKTAFGFLGAVLQKDAEVGEPSGIEDAEKDDGDVYYLFGIFPMGTHKIMPLLIYGNRSDLLAEALRDQDSDGFKYYGAQLAFAGAFGESIGYEAEFDYVNYDQDWDAIPAGVIASLPNGLSDESYALYGAYVNVWTNIGATKVGGLLAYGSYDEDAGFFGTGAGFGFGEDFTPTMFGADFAHIGGKTTNGAENDEYNGVSMIHLYAEFAMSDAMTLFGNGTYWMSNTKEDAWEDADGYEIDLGGMYKITENVTYDVLAAYGQINLDADAAGYDDADAFYRLWHKFTINF